MLGAAVNSLASGPREQGSLSDPIEETDSSWLWCAVVGLRLTFGWLYITLSCGCCANYEIVEECSGLTKYHRTLIDQRPWWNNTAYSRLGNDLLQAVTLTMVGSWSMAWLKQH